MSALALGREGDESRREAVLWAGSLALALAAHLALGLHLLARPPASPVAGDPLPAVEIDMAPPSSAAAPSSRPGEVAPPSAAPDPAVEEAPDVPDVAVPPPEPLARETTPEPAAEAVPQPEIPAPPATVVPPSPAVLLPPPLSLAPPPAAATRRVPDRRPAERTRARPAGAERRAEPQAGRRAATTAAAGSAATAAAGGASAANAAAWRSRLVAYLQSRLRNPPGSTSTGAAGVSFSVARSGAVTSASLVRSSGSPALDAAAMAVLRGPVPPPPPGYEGSLSFSTNFRFR